MISFALDEDQELVRDTVRKFAADELRPNLRAWERARDVPEGARRRIHELSLGLIDVPESMGGAGASLLTALLVHEELSFGDPGAAVALHAPHLAPAAIAELGTDEQAARLLSRFTGGGDAAMRLGAVAWSERGGPAEGMATRAEKVDGGYLLHGSKAFVVNGGRADLTVVFAQVEAGAGWSGLGAFAVESPDARGGTLPRGMTSGERHRLLGLETVFAAPLAFDGLFVPDEDRLAGRGDVRRAASRFFARAALVNAARQVGLARAAFEYALDYDQERTAFGKPVAHFQAIAFTLADMHMDVESARWLLWRAALAVEKDAPEASRLVAEAAVHANEAAWRVADNGVQLLGGAGYIQDFPVEKWERDTKALAMFAPTDELQKLSAAEAALASLAPSESAFAPPLPSSALQPIFT